MHRLVLRFGLPAALMLAFGGSRAVPSPVADPVHALPASRALLSPIAVEDAADSGATLPFDFGRYGVLRLQLRDSGVVTSRTVFTRTTAAGRRPSVGKAPRTLAGTVAGDPASVVRLTVSGGWVAGFVRTASRLLVIAPDDYAKPGRILVSEPEPAPAGARGVRDFADYRATGAQPAVLDPTPIPTVTPPTPLPTPSPTTFATSVPFPVLPTLPSPFPVAVWPSSPLPSPVGSVTPPAVSAGMYNCRIVRCNVVAVDIILDADATYTGVYGAGCEGRQVSILNMVDGMYMAPQTRVHFVAVHVNCRQVQPPLGPPGTSSAAMLGQLRAAWDEEGPNRSLVHLVVGYDFGASDGIGRAYQGGLCGRLHPDAVAGADVPEVLTDRIGVEATPAAGPIRASVSAGPVDIPDVRCAYGYSLYQGVRRPGTNYNSPGEPGFSWLSAKISAHELGHNFNAEHDTTGCGTSAPRLGPIMCEELQEASSIFNPPFFSAISAKRIREWAEAKDGSIAGS